MFLGISLIYFISRLTCSHESSITFDKRNCCLEEHSVQQPIDAGYESHRLYHTHLIGSSWYS